MKYACLYLPVGTTCRLKIIPSIDAENCRRRIYPGKNVRAFGTYCKKTNNFFNYLHSFSSRAFVSDYQLIALHKKRRQPLPVLLQNGPLMPEMGGRQRNRQIFMEYEILQDAYEQLLGLRSYIEHYEEREVRKDCSPCPFGVSFYCTKTGSLSGNHKMQSFSPSRNSWQKLFKHEMQ